MKLVLQLLLSFVFPCTLIAQGSLDVDFKKLSAELFIDSDKKEVSGSVRYVYEVFESDTLILNKRNIIIDKKGVVKILFCLGVTVLFLIMI